ncbi:MAG: hypothetical protein LBG47_04350 [Prevotellaceae bacterium]|jgi:hypothetical protein|nr:hypothetical protein [Prevotellaceae bacterium]
MKRKTIILAALLFSATYVAQAQYTYKPFRIDVGTGLSFPVTTFGIGILGSVEPQYSIGRIAIGARVEYHAENNATEKDGELVKYNSAMLLTGDYRFSSGASRPFVGLGFGSYLMAADFVEHDDGSYSFFGQGAGAMLRAGVDMSHFRFALHYHITGSRKHDDLKVNFNYLALTIAVGIGGGRVSNAQEDK